MENQQNTWSSLLTNEVNSDQVKDDVRKDEISKASFWGDANKLHFVLRVCLQSQAHCGKIR